MRTTPAEIKPELRNPGVPAGWSKPEYTVTFYAPGIAVPKPVKFDNKFEASEAARKWVLSFVAINSDDRFSKGMDNGFACYLRKPYRRLAFATFKQTKKAQPENAPCCRCSNYLWQEHCLSGKDVCLAGAAPLLAKDIQSCAKFNQS